jgi:hypothetical protein
MNDERQRSTKKSAREEKSFTRNHQDRLCGVTSLFVEGGSRRQLTSNNVSSFLYKNFTDDAQHSEVGATKSRSFLTLFASLSSSAAASVRINALSGVIVRSPSVPLVLGVRLLAPLESELGPLGVPGEPDFL